MRREGGGALACSMGSNPGVAPGAMCEYRLQRYLENKARVGGRSVGRAGGRRRRRPVRRT